MYVARDIRQPVSPKGRRVERVAFVLVLVMIIITTDVE